MKSTLPIIVFSSVCLVAAAGCSSKTSSGGESTATLDSASEALSTDDSQSQEAEDGSEEAIENGLGGATPTDEGGAIDGADVAAVDAKLKTNPGLYFQPAGCITSTKLGPGQWKHVFVNCTGPRGRFTFNGTVTSTWTPGASSLEVKHETTDFSVKGPNVTATYAGSRVVTYTRASTLLSKHRKGSWTGTVAKNSAPNATVPWTHDADFTATWDTGSKCFTRDGSANNSVNGKTFGRTVTGYRACGGILACPSAGEIVLERKDGSVKITITFLGGQDIQVTGPKGNTVKLKIACVL